MGIKKPCTDHNGIVFESADAMCEAYHISRSTYTNRRARGWSVEEALTTSTQGFGQKINHSHTVYDHLGNEYKSALEMCKHYGIPRSVYHARIAHLKWSMEKALTEPVKTPTEAANSVECVDHEGTTFPSITQMCKHWNIPRNTFNLRIAKGWSLERALTTKIKPVDTGKRECKDHLGNIYKTTGEMYKAYGLTKEQYRKRKKMGWSLEKILTEPIVNSKKECMDHLGNKYDSITEMCEAYGIEAHLYSGRIKQGKTVKQALTGEPSRYYFDHLGNKFITKLDMCAYWNIDYKTYIDRIQRMSLEDALTTIVPNTKLDEHVTVVSLIEKPYYKIIIDDVDNIWSIREIFNYYRKTKGLTL